MSRHFRPWTIDQTQLLPAAVVDYVPADHLAQFVVALAREHLDLSEIVASYKSGLGQEDKLHGASRRGDEMPGWIADKQKRLAKIREAGEALEAEAAAAAAAKAEAERAAEEKRRPRTASARGRFLARPQKSLIPR